MEERTTHKTTKDGYRSPEPAMSVLVSLKTQLCDYVFVFIPAVWVIRNCFSLSIAADKDCLVLYERHGFCQQRIVFNYCYRIV